MSSNVRTWASAIFIWVFLAAWLSLMTAGLTAGACRNGNYAGDKKLRFCTVSLMAAAWTKVSATERAKGAIIRLERAIALSQTGREEEARNAFARALQDARAKRGPWEQALHRRMVRLDHPRSLALWLSAARSAD